MQKIVSRFVPDEFWGDRDRVWSDRLAIIVGAAALGNAINAKFKAIGTGQQ